MIGGFYEPDVAVDLGTANTLVFVRGHGIVLSEPSVVAVNTKTDAIVAVGSEAKGMMGCRAPAHVIATRPLEGGVITDFRATEEMLSRFFRWARRVRRAQRYLVRARAAVCVPMGTTPVALRTIKKVVESAGVRKVHAVEGSLATAAGAGMPMDEPEGSMVVDVGGGTTEVAAISLGGVVSGGSVRVAGDDMDRAIAAHIQKEHRTILPPPSVEWLKIELGSALPLPEEIAAEVWGLDLVTRSPRSVVATSEDIRGALSGPVSVIVGAVRDTLNRVPLELVSDLVDRGIVLAGGGALLKGLPEHLRRETGVPVRRAEEPFTCAVIGGGHLLEKL
jgi:rod shape-determining protein MreB and related proteins